MAVVIAFVAWSNTGKTTYLERLIPLLKNVGVRVGVLNTTVMISIWIVLVQIHTA